MENVVKYFDDFKAASYFAKANPGSKITRDGDKFKVEGKGNFSSNSAVERKSKAPNSSIKALNEEDWDDIPF